MAQPTLYTLLTLLILITTVHAWPFATGTCDATISSLRKMSGPGTSGLQINPYTILLDNQTIIAADSYYFNQSLNNTKIYYGHKKTHTIRIIKNPEVASTITSFRGLLIYALHIPSLQRIGQWVINDTSLLRLAPLKQCNTGETLSHASNVDKSVLGDGFELTWQSPLFLEKKMGNEVLAGNSSIVFRAALVHQGRNGWVTMRSRRIGVHPSLKEKFIAV